MSNQNITINVPLNTCITININPIPTTNTWTHQTENRPITYCRRCGYMSHDITNCWAKYDVLGYSLQPLFR